jgi:hypothetical protein
MATMTDAATFTPAMLEGAAAVAGYFGGPNAYRAWTDNEWKATGTTPKLPIWVPKPSATASDARNTDIWQILSQCLHYQVPRGTAIAFDLETSQADVSYMEEMNACLQYFGFGIIGYGSLSTINNAVPSYIWKWDADWTGVAHLTPGMAATQWTNGQQFDTSEISPQLAAILTWRKY